MIAAMGWLGSALIVLALTRTDLRELHGINLLAALVLVAFNVVMAIPSMIALNIVLVLVNSYQLLRGRRSAGSRSLGARPEPTVTGSPSLAT